MNKFRFLKGGAIFLLLAVLFTNCEKEDTDIPPIATINPDNIITLGEIREMIVSGETYTFHGTDKHLFATVTMDEQNGNIYRQAYIQDPNGAVNLRMAVSADLSVGDSIRLSLDGSSISYFNNMLQLDSVDGTKQIVKQASERFIEPEVVTINDIKAGGYQAKLVKLENVQFIESEIDSTWADGINLQNVSRTLQDCDLNTIIVRTSGYADFANEKLPEGKGDFIGIVSQYRDVWQLLVRNIDELTLDGERCPLPGDGMDVLTIAEIKELHNQGATTIPANSILEGVVISDREHDNHPGQNLYLMDENGDGITLRFEAFHSFNMGTQIRIVAGNLPLSRFNELLQISDIPLSSGVIIDDGILPEPTLITIAELNANFTDYESTLIRIENVVIPPTGTFSGNIAVSDGTGQANMYTYPYASFAGTPVTPGIYNITVIASIFNQVQLLLRNLDDLEFVDEYDPGGSGSGTFEDPYDVVYAYNNNTGDDVWVQGYIIGVMETDVDPFAPNFNPPFRTNSNIIIADSPGETNMDNALIVQLLFGTGPRAALNLVDNQQRLGAFAKLKGNLSSYFGVPGMTGTSDYWLEDDEPDLPDPVTFIDEDFQSYPDHSIIENYGWTAYAEAGSRNWICRTFQNNHYAQATAFNSADAQNIMWMITPPIDLDAMTNPTFEFESAKAFYTHDGFSLHISTNFDGENVTNADWQTLDAVLAGQSDADNAWIHSGLIDLSSYSGIVHIAWKYVSAAPQGNTGTFRVDNVKLYEGD